MGAIVILICFLGSGALTVFLVELCRDDWKKRKCHVTWVENLLGTADELKLDRGSPEPVELRQRMLRERVSAFSLRNRKEAGIGTGTSSAAD